MTSIVPVPVPTGDDRSCLCSVLEQLYSALQRITADAQVRPPPNAVRST